MIGLLLLLLANQVDFPVPDGTGHHVDSCSFCHTILLGNPSNPHDLTSCLANKLLESVVVTQIVQLRSCPDLCCGIALVYRLLEPSESFVFLPELIVNNG